MGTAYIDPRRIDKIYKSGTNRGNRRVWIEGSALQALQWERGTRFDIERQQQFGLVSDCLVLVRTVRGKRRVAGTDTRPIIDINAKFLNDLFGDCTHFRAIGGSDWIVIQPCDEEGKAQ